VGSTLPENFQPIPNGNVLVLGADLTLWIEKPPFGAIPPNRVPVDGHVRAFRWDPRNSGNIFVLGTDRKLWLERPPFEIVPPPRWLVDENVSAFQPIDSTHVFVLDRGATLWYEQHPVGAPSTSRSKIDAKVLAFQPVNANTVAILRKDGSLWLVQGSFGRAALHFSPVDRNVLSFQAPADGSGKLYVRANDCTLWLESPPFGASPANRVQVGANVAFVDPLDSSHAYVLDNDGNVSLATAPFSAPIAIDQHATYLQAAGPTAVYVLGADGSLWLESVPSEKRPPSRVQVDGGLFRNFDVAGLDGFIWDTY
jgi:hypothetical protein